MIARQGAVVMGEGASVRAMIAMAKPYAALPEVVDEAAVQAFKQWLAQQFAAETAVGNAAMESAYAQEVRTAFALGVAKAAGVAVAGWDKIVDQMPEPAPPTRQYAQQTGSLLNVTPGPGPAAGAPWIP
jgi:hypothetical protein